MRLPHRRHADAATMRHVVRLGLVLIAGWSMTGCTSGIIGAVMAPGDVVAGAAGSAIQTGAQALSNSGINDLANPDLTLRELDLALAQRESMDPAMVQNLDAYRNDLRDGRQGGANTMASRRPMDTPLPRRRSDWMVVKPPGEGRQPRRTTGRPDGQATNAMLEPEASPYIMSLDNVRLNY